MTPDPAGTRVAGLPGERFRSPAPRSTIGSMTVERCGGSSGSPGLRRPIRSSRDSSGLHWSPVAGLSSISWPRRRSTKRPSRVRLDGPRRSAMPLTRSGRSARPGCGTPASGNRTPSSGGGILLRMWRSWSGRGGNSPQAAATENGPSLLDQGLHGLASFVHTLDFF